MNKTFIVKGNEMPSTPPSLGMLLVQGGKKIQLKHDEALQTRIFWIFMTVSATFFNCLRRSLFTFYQRFWTPRYSPSIAIWLARIRRIAMVALVSVVQAFSASFHSCRLSSLHTLHVSVVSLDGWMVEGQMKTTKVILTGIPIHIPARMFTYVCSLGEDRPIFGRGDQSCGHGKSEVQWIRKTSLDPPRSVILLLDWVDGSGTRMQPRCIFPNPSIRHTVVWEWLSTNRTDFLSCAKSNFFRQQAMWQVSSKICQIPWRPSKNDCLDQIRRPCNNY